jgi:hypothetical protein
MMELFASHGTFFANKKGFSSYPDASATTQNLPVAIKSVSV